MSSLRSAATVVVVLLAAQSCSVGPFGVDAAGRLDLSPGSPVIGAIGDRIQLVASNGSTGIPATIVWRSSDVSVATVDELGFVTAVGDGTATITAEGGGMVGSTTVTVAATIVQTIRVVSDQADGNPGNDEVEVSVTVFAEGAAVSAGASPAE